ncbi:MAG: four helix bundle protein [Burkholderiales bacterium]|nr:four helix bundle protein [Burkholderiales bacterium]
MTRPHYNLEAWKAAMVLVKSIYETTRTFPREEIYGLTAQMQRAAISIPSNLAEGAARTGRKKFAQFLSIAKGSLSELETQLLISVELGYLDQKHGVFQLVEEVSRLLSGLHRNVTQ